MRQFALRRSGQELGGHRREDAVVAGGVIAQRVTQAYGHQAGIARAGQQVVQPREELFATMAAELLAAATQRELPQLDEKLYLEVFAQPEAPAPRRAAGRR